MNNNSPSFVRNQSDDFENIVCTNIGDELVVSKLITMNSSLLEDVEQLMYKMKSYKKCLAELASKLNEIKGIGLLQARIILNYLQLMYYLYVLTWYSFSVDIIDCRQLNCTNDVDDKSTSGSTMTDLEVALTGLDGLTMDDVTYNSTEENRDQDDTRAAKIDEFPMLDVSKASLAEPSTGRLHDIVELPNIFQNNNAKIANKLRLSNNPSVRKLKVIEFLTTAFYICITHNIYVRNFCSFTGVEIHRRNPCFVSYRAHASNCRRRRTKYEINIFHSP